MSKKNPSRNERFERTLQLVKDAKTEFEELKTELEDWLEGMPENLQSGSKAEELQEAIDALDEVIENCDTVEGIEVNFPGMF